MLIDTEFGLIGLAWVVVSGCVWVGFSRGGLDSIRLDWIGLDWMDWIGRDGMGWDGIRLVELYSMRLHRTGVDLGWIVLRLI